MSIITLDGALAGMQAPWAFAKGITPTLVAGRPQSLWFLGGFPAAASAPANTAGGTALVGGTAGGGFGSNIAGQIPRGDPSSGYSYLGRLNASASQAGTLLLCDRLMQIAGTSSGSAISVTTTGAQTITSGSIPARDINATTNGLGVLAGLEIYSATGAGAATPTISYTNSAGSSGQTGSLANLDTYVASSAAGAFYRFGLASGDQGVRSIQSLTLNVSMTSGTICLVLYRVLAALELVGAYVPNAIDCLTGGFPQWYGVGAVPFLIFLPSTTTAANISGTYTETQG